MIGGQRSICSPALRCRAPIGSSIQKVARTCHQIGGGAGAKPRDGFLAVLRRGAYAGQKLTIQLYVGQPPIATSSPGTIKTLDLQSRPVASSRPTKLPRRPAESPENDWKRVLPRLELTPQHGKPARRKIRRFATQNLETKDRIPCTEPCPSSREKP